MKKLDPARIRKGKNRLYIALALLVIAHLAAFLLNFTANGFGSTERLLLSRTALVLVAGLGVLRGSESIRYVLQAVLLIGAAGSVYLLTQGRPGPAEYSIFIPDIVLGVAVAALLQFDPMVRDFFTYQRSQNFGERVAIGPESGGSTSEPAPKPKKKDSWDELIDLYEDEEKD